MKKLYLILIVSIILFFGIIIHEYIRRDNQTEEEFIKERRIFIISFIFVIGIIIYLLIHRNIINLSYSNIEKKIRMNKLIKKYAGESYLKTK